MNEITMLLPLEDQMTGATIKPHHYMPKNIRVPAITFRHLTTTIAQNAHGSFLANVACVRLNIQPPGTVHNL